MISCLRQPPVLVRVCRTNLVLAACWSTVFALACVGTTKGVSAQDQYRLSAAQSGVSSEATVSQREISLRNNGTTTRYVRERRFDSADGKWIGYTSRQASQAIRWPISNRGNLQIGTLRGATANFRPSKMVIQPIEITPPVGIGGPSRVAGGFGGGLAALGEPRSDLFAAVTTGQPFRGPESLYFGTHDNTGNQFVLGRNAFRQLRAGSPAAASQADWLVVPSAGGLIRIECFDRGEVVAAGMRNGALSLRPLTQHARQLWRPLLVGPPSGQRFILENAFHPGHCLALDHHGHLHAEPISFTHPHFWIPLRPHAPIPVQPFFRSISHKIVAADPLPPAEVELVNTHRYTLTVLLGDRRQGDRFTQIKIPAGQSETLRLDRDAGGTVIEVHEVLTPTGDWLREEFETPIPPRAFYDISVYEDHLQSVAIDRTGKSPQAIEDTNYVPKSVGWLPMAAELPNRLTVDAYADAAAAANPGAVRRLSFEQLEPKKSQPLDAILDQIRAQGN